MSKRGVAFLAGIAGAAIWAAVLGGIGWIIFKIIIGVKIGQAIDNVTKSPLLLVLIVVGAIVGLKIWKSIFK